MVCVLALSGCISHQQPLFTLTDNLPNQNPPRRIVWIWIDKDFSIWSKMNISEAIASWDYALNDYIQLRVAMDGIYQANKPEMPRMNDWVIHKVNAGARQLPTIEAARVVLGAVDYVGGSNLFLAENAMRVGDIYFITLHEIGHLLGAQHRGNKLMFPDLNRDKFRCIDYGTIDQVAETQHLPVDRLNYCKRNWF